MTDEKSKGVSLKWIFGVLIVASLAGLAGGVGSLSLLRAYSAAICGWNVVCHLARQVLVEGNDTPIPGPAPAPSPNPARCLNDAQTKAIATLAGLMYAYPAPDPKSIGQEAGRTCWTVEDISYNLCLALKGGNSANLTQPNPQDTCKALKP